MKNCSEKNGVIYKVTNPSGRVYIGKTKNFLKRMAYYKRADCKTQPVLLKSILKHGWESHTIEIIENVVMLDIDSREKYWIDLYKSNLSRHPDEGGMNCTDGGEGQCGRKHSDEAKEKIRLTHTGNTYNKGRKMPEHVKQVLLDANLGKKLSAEHKEKISLSGIISGRSLPCTVRKYKTGDFVGEYRSISEACIHLNIFEMRNRAYQVANGVKNRNQTKGYVFKYA